MKPNANHLAPIQPFEKIAVTISGGGFRAAAYGLGCLSYLSRIKRGNNTLLSRVKFIASASGGTMPAILFTAYQTEGKTFEECYKYLREQVLKGTYTIEKVCTVLQNDKLWKEKYPLKKRNLINGFAAVYDELLFEGRKYGTYWNKEHNPTVDEVCFNSAELVNGRTFRFETNGLTPTHLFTGNRYLSVTDNNGQEIKDIRLGDIMAASSCFPGGFEPIIYPDDFATDSTHKNALLGNLQQAKDYDYDTYIPYPHSFPLMDGGITDNQAMESLKLADERSRKRSDDEGFDLMLVCDVANYFMDEIKPTDETKKWWNIKSIQWFVNLHKYAAMTFGVSVIVLLVYYKFFSASYPHSIPYFIALTWGAVSVSGVMTALYLFGNFRLNATLSGLKTYLGKNGWMHGAKGILDFFFKLPLYRSIGMVQERITTVMRILTDVQLLQIRRLNYDFAFGKPEWLMRFKAVNIYELSSSNKEVLARYFKNMLSQQQSNQGKLTAMQIAFLTPTTEVQQTAENARNMGTTLWFTADDEKNNIRDQLIATGQFTTCFNLLNYSYQLENMNHSFASTSEFKTMLNDLENDWENFQENARWMV